VLTFESRSWLSTADAMLIAPSNNRFEFVRRGSSGALGSTRSSNDERRRRHHAYH
jgi:hypothetical protein